MSVTDVTQFISRNSVTCVTGVCRSVFVYMRGNCSLNVKFIQCCPEDAGFDMYKYKTGRSEKRPVLGIQALFSVFVRRSAKELFKYADKMLIGKIATLFSDS